MDPGTDAITVVNKTLVEYLPQEILRKAVKSPLVVTATLYSGGLTWSSWCYETLYP